MFHSHVLNSILLGGHCSGLLCLSMFRFEVQAPGADNHIDDDRYQNHGKEKFLRHTCNLLDA